MKSIVTFLTLLVSLMSFNAWATDVSNAQILSEAESYPNGTYVGECKVFVQNVVGDVGLSLGTGYRDCYISSGFEVMNWAEAIPGDVIQVSHDTNPTSTSYVHTAIIRGFSGGGFDVIESNWNKDGKVGRRYGWDPAAWADQWGENWSAHIYRLEKVTPEYFDYYKDAEWASNSTCYGPLKYFEDSTAYCYGQSDVFPQGYKVRSRVEINNITEDFRFRVEAWDMTNTTNPIFHWVWTPENWNYVSGTWDRSYFTPEFNDPTVGNWMLKIFVDSKNDNDNYFIKIDDLAFTVEDSDFFYDYYAYKSNLSENPYDYKAYSCVGPIVGGEETGWEFSCYQNNKTSVFVTGQSPYILVKIRDIRENHMFRAVFYKDGVYQNTVESDNWNYVTGQWGKAFFWAQKPNATSGSWEARISVDTGSGFEEIDKVNFAVIPQNPLPYGLVRNGTTCLGPITGGQETNWFYTCSNEATVFNTGDTVQSLLYVENISVAHTFQVKAYKNGVYQWEWQENTRNPQWLWAYSFFSPTLSNSTAGDWEFRIYLTASGNYRQIDTIKFKVIDSPV